MEVLPVRSIEKTLDAVYGHLKHTCWNAVLNRDDGLRVLQVSPIPPQIRNQFDSSVYYRPVLPVRFLPTMG